MREKVKPKRRTGRRARRARDAAPGPRARPRPCRNRIPHRTRARGEPERPKSAVGLAGLGDLLDELLDRFGLAPAEASRDVGLGNDPDEPVLLVDDGEPTDL